MLMPTATSTPRCATSPGAPTLDREAAAQTRHAPRYRVLVHDDPFTHADFVVNVLRVVFHKAIREAYEIMLTADSTGLAHVATLPLEQAEFRVDRAHSLSRTQGFPLTFTYEPE